MNNFQVTIGIEVHCALNTQSKMFSCSPVNANAPVNTLINEVDLGLPGILPSPNKMAVVKAIQLATALHMEIDHTLKFDRKNYFYPDLPKGYQITQQYSPIGKNGYLELSPERNIKINRIQIEEDTAKQQMVDGKLCLDYNRCGVPLIEIVSQPEITSAEEAVEYLTVLKRILVFLNISDGKMEDGSLRADINISVAPYGAKKLGTKVEIKNINSFNNIASAIKFEIQKQTNQLLKGELVEQQTKKWDANINQTVFMRQKADNVDYRFFCEPNIISLDINYLISEATASIKELPSAIKAQLLENNVPANIVDQLLDDYEAYRAFNYVNTRIHNSALVVTWILIELGGLLKLNNKTYEALDLETYDRLITVIELLVQGKINGKQTKTLFEQVFLTKKDAAVLIHELGFEQITDKDTIHKYLKQYVDDNANMIEQYNVRPERVEKFFLGLLMRDTKGQANPNIAIEVLRKIIRKD